MRTKLIIILAIIAAAFSSCLKDDVIMYGEQSFCDVKDGKLYTDSGNIYNVTTNSTGAVWDTLSRVFIYCNVLNETKDAANENEYDIDLKDFARVLPKVPVNKSTADDAVIGTDPVLFVQGWVTGVDKVNLNMRFAISYKKDSNTAHLLNVAYDDVKSNSDTLVFEMRHNGSGEVLGADGIPDDQIAMGDGYLTIKLDDYLPTDKESVVIRINSVWYKQFAGYYSKETEPVSTTATLLLPQTKTRVIQGGNF
ncbi:MAG: hypothetical protein IJS07_06865 [Bacteroidales bacterium]|nr:hypothetical protein [Bacteroidales bacterium]